jgi:hypothetical protein
MVSSISTRDILKENFLVGNTIVWEHNSFWLSQHDCLGAQPFLIESTRLSGSTTVSDWVNTNFWEHNSFWLSQHDFLGAQQFLLKFYLQSVSLCVYLCFNIFLVKCKLNRKRYVLLNQKLLCSQKIVLTQSETVVLPEIRVDSIRNCCTPGQSCWLNQKRLCSQLILLLTSFTYIHVWSMSMFWH